VEDVERLDGILGCRVAVLPMTYGICFGGAIQVSYNSVFFFDK